MTVVVDASALIAVLTDPGPVGARVSSTISSSDLLAPYLVDLEVAQRLRRYDRQGRSNAAAALRRFRLVPIKRFDHKPLLPRIWELRHNFTVYDAAYVALAEATACPLVTLDRKLANALGHRADIIVL